MGRIYSFGNLNRDTFNGLPGMLADSLPDTYGRALFDQWLTLTGRISGNPVETLCFLGQRCMGALEFEPATGPATDENMETGEVRSGQITAPEGFDYYLIKLDGVSAEAGFKETENYGRLEYSFSELVKRCGIEMTDCSLIEENGRAHFLTKRFDRENGRKIHMQTLCGMAHYDFKLQRGYSYEQAFNVMRRLRLPYSQAQEMFRRVVFNVVLRNQDDHTKNISFLMDSNGQWRLSPAYDIGFAYNPEGAWTKTHQMSVNGKFDGLTRKDLLECAAVNNIKNAPEIIDQICEVASGWPTLAKECGVPQTMIDAIVPHLLLKL